MEYTIKIYETGSIKSTTRYTSTGLFHSVNDQPSRVYINGSKEWHKDNKLHRDGDLPAIIWADGRQEWRQNGKLHRDDDKPAIIWADGQQEWRQNGKLHRENDQPAIIFADGGQAWYQKDIEYFPNEPVTIKLTREMAKILLEQLENLV